MTSDVTRWSRGLTPPGSLWWSPPRSVGRLQASPLPRHGPGSQPEKTGVHGNGELLHCALFNGVLAGFIDRLDGVLESVFSGRTLHLPRRPIQDDQGLRHDLDHLVPIEGTGEMSEWIPSAALSTAAAAAATDSALLACSTPDRPWSNTSILSPFVPPVAVPATPNACVNGTEKTFVSTTTQGRPCGGYTLNVPWSVETHSSIHATHRAQTSGDAMVCCPPENCLTPLTFIVKDNLFGFAGSHWIPPPQAFMECLLLSMEQLRTSLSAIGTRLDSIRAKDCGEIYRISKGSMDSGIYTIYPRASGGGNNSAPLRVFCRVEAGRAWTVIQRRQDGSVDFYNRTWEDYSRGFGSLTGEFWLGNDNIHLLTSQGRYKLDVDLRRFANCFRKKCHPAAEFYMQYDIFLVENAQAMYKLLLGNYTGTKGQNWWRGQNTAIFRNKPCSASEGSHSRSCYLLKMGGFWVHRCDTMNPNGYYYDHNGTGCPKKSQWKPPGIFTFRYIEMRISKTE